MNIKTNWEIGPTFITLCIQTIGGAVLIGMIYMGLQDGMLSLKTTLSEYREIQKKQSDILSELKDRVIKVETIEDSHTRTIQNLDTKLDHLNEKVK